MNKSCWATSMIKTMKKVNNPYFAHFSNEINFINYLTNIFSGNLNINNMENSKNQEENWLKREKKIKQEEIESLLKSLGIFPEQYFSFGWEDEFGNVNISQNFYHKNSNINENYLFADKNIKSTKDSLRIKHKFTDRSNKFNDISNLFNYELKKKSIVHDSYMSDYRNNTILEAMQINQICEENEEKEIDYNKQKIQNLHHYKLITEIIEKQLENSDIHPLALLKKKFISFYLNYYRILMKEVAKFQDYLKRMKYIKVIYEDSIRDLQQFIRVFEETTAVYYNLEYYKTVMKPPFFFCKDNLLNFITSIIFSDSELYDFLLDLQIQHEFEKETDIIHNLNLCENWKIEDFNVANKFRLSEKTEKMEISQEKFSKNLFHSESNSCESILYLQEHSKTTNITPLLNNNRNEKFFFKTGSLCADNFRINMRTLACDNMFLNLGKNVVRRSEFINEKKKNQEPNEEQPYFFAIRNLKKIEKIRSPILKLKNIIKTSVFMIDAINKFYQKNKMINEHQVESDDILALFIYICSKAQVKHLYSQCKLIEKFLTCKIANSISGYYLITLMASLTFFVNKIVHKS